MNNPDYLNVFQVDQLQSLAMFFLDLREKGFTVAQLFYGAWLFPHGYLVYKSGFLPQILGIVLMIHCCIWLMTSLQFFLFADFIAEFGLTLWLLIMAVKHQKSA